MTEHELTPCGFANCVVAQCLLAGYRADLQLKLDKVMTDWRYRKYVPEDDQRVLLLKGYTLAGLEVRAHG